MDLMHVLLLVFYAKSFSKTSQYQPDIFRHLWYHILGVLWDEYDWIWAFELTWKVIIFWKHELKSVLSWKNLSTWVKKLWILCMFCCLFFLIDIFQKPPNVDRIFFCTYDTTSWVFLGMNMTLFGRLNSSGKWQFFGNMNRSQYGA